MSHRQPILQGTLKLNASTFKVIRLLEAETEVLRIVSAPFQLFACYPGGHWRGRPPST